MNMKFHHIGIACRDIRKYREFLGQLFTVSRESEIVTDSEQDASVCMIELENGLKLELIQGAKVEQVIRKGVTFYHLCFSVSNIDATVQELAARNCLVVREPAPAVLFGGKRVAFLNTHIGLIEIMEECDEDSSSQ